MQTLQPQLAPQLFPQNQWGQPQARPQFHPNMLLGALAENEQLVFKNVLAMKARQHYFAQQITTDHVDDLRAQSTTLTNVVSLASHAHLQTVGVLRVQCDTLRQRIHDLEEQVNRTQEFVDKVASGAVNAETFFTLRLAELKQAVADVAAAVAAVTPTPEEPSHVTPERPAPRPLTRSCQADPRAERRAVRRAGQSALGVVCGHECRFGSNRTENGALIDFWFLFHFPCFICFSVFFQDQAGSGALHCPDELHSQDSTNHTMSE